MLKIKKTIVPYYIWRICDYRTEDRARNGTIEAAFPLELTHDYCNQLRTFLFSKLCGRVQL
jgi:hypothetical protein